MAAAGGNRSDHEGRRDVETRRRLPGAGLEATGGPRRLAGSLAYSIQRGLPGCQRRDPEVARDRTWMVELLAGRPSKAVRLTRRLEGQCLEKQVRDPFAVPLPDPLGSHPLTLVFLNPSVRGPSACPAKRFFRSCPGSPSPSPPRAAPPTPVSCDGWRAPRPA